MKAKIFLFGLVSLLALSCSGDDDNATEVNPEPETVKLLTEVEIDFGDFSEEFDLSYFQNNTVRSFSQADMVCLFAYSGERVSSMEILYNGEPYAVAGFEYDGSGHIIKMTINGIEKPVTFQDNCYSFYFEPNDADITICLNEWGDIDHYTIYYHNFQDQNIVSFEYDSEKYGSLYASHNFMLYFLMVRPYPDYFIWVSAFTLRPVSEIHTDFYQSIINQNEFDNEDYLKKTIGLEEDDSHEIRYSYVEL